MFYKTPIAYKGNDPYIFISYAHKDSVVVLPVISRILDDGYKAWYDEGIQPGKNWDVYISEHIDRSNNVLIFMSKSYIESQNCRDEMTLARLKRKPMNIVYIDDVQLSSGLRMRYGRIQALFMNNMPEDEFFDKLYMAEGISATK